MLRTGTLALAAVIAALFMGGASAHAAAEAPPATATLPTRFSSLVEQASTSQQELRRRRSLARPTPSGFPGATRLGAAGTQTRGDTCLVGSSRAA